MSSFTETFGGSAVSPSQVAFAAYSFGANFTLFWPDFSYGQPNVAARFMNMTATAGSLDVFMPDATLVSVGYDTIIFNAGSDSFNVVDFNGGAIATIASGQIYYILLNDNSTQSGGWQTVQFGVGTGSADAAALAGSGLLAAAGLLNVNLAAQIVNTSFSVTASDATVPYVWNGGSGTITLPIAASVGNGFFIALANNGSGSVTAATTSPDTIDGNPTSVFSQTQSGFILSDGQNWITLGKGIQNTFAVTLLNLNVAGSSNITETSSQAQNIIQQFTGVLTGNIAVIVPNTVQLYVCNNLTTGPYTITVRTSAGTGIIVPQGNSSILYCDGTNVDNAFTASVSGNLTLNNGSATSPSLNFVNSLSTGLYSPGTGVFSATANGTEVMQFSAQTSAVNYFGVVASATGSAVALGAAGSDTNINIVFVPKGSGFVSLGNLDSTIIGANIPDAITGTTITASSFVGPLTGDVTGNVTGNVNGNATNVTGIVSPVNGGTGIANNSASTLTITGSFATSLTVSGATNLTLPTSGTVTALGNVATGTDSVVLATSPTISAPTLTGTTAAAAITASGVINSTSGVQINAHPVFSQINTQSFTATGTYTPTLDTAYVEIEMVGGGGGGGGNSGNSATGGGGNGGYLRAILTAAQLGATEAITIGAAGSAGSNSGGGNGGTTSVGSLLSCTGGNGGAAALGGINAGGTGGSPTVTTGKTIVAYQGQQGGYGSGDFLYVGGAGGSSPLGTGGATTVAPNMAGPSGNAGTGYGSGGSGSCQNATGGAGMPGYVVITEYISA